MLLDKGSNLEAKTNVSLMCGSQYMVVAEERGQGRDCLVACTIHRFSALRISIVPHLLKGLYIRTCSDALYCMSVHGIIHPEVSLSLCVSVSDSLVALLSTSPLGMVMWK